MFFSEPTKVGPSNNEALTLLDDAQLRNFINDPDYHSLTPNYD